MNRGLTFKPCSSLLTSSLNGGERRGEGRRGEETWPFFDGWGEVGGLLGGGRLVGCWVGGGGRCNSFFSKALTNC